MEETAELIPLFTTDGEVGAIYRHPYLFNPQGEWIGWVTVDGSVYSVSGSFAGCLTNDRRIVRPRAYDYTRPSILPPPPPKPIRPPGLFPLPPMMAELAYNSLDVLQDAPELLPTTDAGELRQDMD